MVPQPTPLPYVTVAPSPSNITNTPVTNYPTIHALPTQTKYKPIPPILAVLGSRACNPDDVSKLNADGPAMLGRMPRSDPTTGARTPADTITDLSTETVDGESITNKADAFKALDQPWSLVVRTTLYTLAMPTTPCTPHHANDCFVIGGYKVHDTGRGVRYDTCHHRGVATDIDRTRG